MTILTLLGAMIFWGFVGSRVLERVFHKRGYGRNGGDIGILVGALGGPLVLFAIWALLPNKNELNFQPIIKEGTKYYFLSYSRQELTFTDSLAQELAQRNFNTWMDIYQLRPGQSWQEQIDRAIDGSEALLLVVSQAALASSNVHYECQRAKQSGKRLILLLVEHIPATRLTEILTEESQLDWRFLQECERIDFRVNFKKALPELVGVLNSSERKVPEESLMSYYARSRYKLPSAPRYFIGISGALSLLTLLNLLAGLLLLPQVLSKRTIADQILNYGYLGSLLLLVGLLAAAILIPLPYRVYKRQFNYWRVSLVLIAALVIMSFVNIITPWLLGLPLFGLLMLLGRPGMYRWAGPAGALSYSYPKWLVVVLVIAPAILCNGMVALDYNEQLANKVFPTMGAILVLTQAVWISGLGSLKYRRLVQVETSQQPKTFYLDYAPEDADAARTLTAYLSKQHQQASPEQADIILVLLSRFKQQTADQYRADKMVLPVMLEDIPLNRIPEALTRRQWVDLRRGLSHAQLNTLSDLLHEPALLAASLGAFPERVRVRPTAIRLAAIVLGAAIFLTLVPTAFWQAALFFQRTVPSAFAGISPQDEIYILDTSDDDLRVSMVGEPKSQAGVELVRLGQSQSVVRFLELVNHPDNTRLGSKPYNFDEVWCGIIDDSNRRDDMTDNHLNQLSRWFLGFWDYSQTVNDFDGHFEPFTLALYLHDPEAAAWTMASTEIGNVFDDDDYRTFLSEIDCEPILTHHDKTNEYAYANLAGLLTTPVLGIAALQRFWRRKRRVQILLTLLVIGCAGFFLLSNDYFFGAAAVLYGVILGATVISKDLRQWIPF